MIQKMGVFIIHTCMNKIRFLKIRYNILICVNPLYPWESACYSLFNYGNILLPLTITLPFL